MSYGFPSDAALFARCSAGEPGKIVVVVDCARLCFREKNRTEKQSAILAGEDKLRDCEQPNRMNF
jgi:hypothetical protein